MKALDANTTASYNTAIGQNNAGANTTGSNNTTVGYDCFYTNTTGHSNVAMGAGCMANNTTAANNTAVGFNALNANTTGHSNSALGEGAGELITTGIKNTCIGQNAGQRVTTGENNTYLGREAGYQATTGSHNICIGYMSGENITTASSSVNVGKGIDNSDATEGDQINLGTDIVGHGVQYLKFGSGSTDTICAFGGTSLSAPSDERYKKDIETSTAGLSFINDLRPVTFNWKNAGDVPSDHRSYIEGSTTPVMNAKHNHGFIAQEVKTVIDAHSEIKNGFDMWDEDKEGRQRIADGALVPMLVKAVQELSAQNEALSARITTLEG